MKTYVFLFMLFLSCLVKQATGQILNENPNGGYLNLEKYWFYRYRLVNDFMKIGLNCGESIPVQRREIYSDNYTSNHLTWGDATIDLGNYIVTLATEHRLLENNHLSTARTDDELEKALSAFERLDKNAEAYSHDILGTYPCNPAQDPYANQLNGFFIRDDIPYLTFQDDNFQHFNRPGALIPIYHTLDATHSYTSRYLPEGGMEGRHHAAADGTWTYTDKCVPSEESADQTVNIAMGFALTSKLLGSVPLGVKARSNLRRMIEYIDNGPGIIWNIFNPATGKCVYGIYPDRDCNHGGANFGQVAYGAAKACDKWAPFPSSSLVTDAAILRPLWMFSQWLATPRDANFWGTYAAISDDWRILSVINTTWTRMKQFSRVHDDAMPELPYVYRVLHNKGVDWRFKETRIKLDEAPPCGIHNYFGDYSNRISWETGLFKHNSDYSWNWSGNDLIHEYYSREPTRTGPPKTTSRDYNGLDYMALHNIYNLQDATYMTSYFNSYYKENFDYSVPASFFGTYYNQIKFNFLEYVSSVSKVHPLGYLTIRCAKAIDLIPGFEVENEGTFLAYIDDYHIDCGSDAKDGHPGIPSEEYHYVEIKSIPKPSGPTVVQGADTANTYALDYAPDAVPYIPDSSAFSTIPPEEDTITCEQEHAAFDSVVAEIYASGNLDQIAMIDSLMPYVSFPCDSAGSTMRKTNAETGIKNINNFNIYPDPNNGHFTITFDQVGDYDVKIYSALGTVVYQTHVYSRRSEVVHIDGLASGIYTAEVVNSHGAQNKQVKKIIISY